MRLATQFNAATNSVIELIDVLWLDQIAVAAAFEVEKSTSIYSGLLRMSDLLVNAAEHQHPDLPGRPPRTGGAKSQPKSAVDRPLGHRHR